MKGSTVKKKRKREREIMLWPSGKNIYKTETHWKILSKKKIILKDPLKVYLQLNIQVCLSMK